MMSKSKRFKMVKEFYDSGRWSKEMVRNAVGRWITEEEFREITGKAYKA